MAASPAETTAPDTVSLSTPAAPPSRRTEMWAALKASELLTASLVPGPLGAGLAAHRAELGHLLAELEGAGIGLYAENGIGRTLLSLGKTERRVEPDEALRELTAGTRLSLRFPGMDALVPVGSLDVLAAADAFTLGGSADSTAAPHRVRALQNLGRAGYVFQDGLPAAYCAQYPKATTPAGQKQTFSGAQLGAEDYFKVTHDPAALEHPELARLLEDSREILEDPPEQLYTDAHQSWSVNLTARDLRLVEPRGTSQDEWKQALANLRTGRLILEQVFPDTDSGAARVTRTVLRHDGQVDPVEAARVLRRLQATAGEKSRVDVDDLYAAEVQAGHRGETLMHRLDLMVQVGHAVGLADARASADFLTQPPPGLADLTRVERVQAYSALSRAVGGKTCRSVLSTLFEEPQKDSAERLDLLARLACASSLAGTPARGLTDSYHLLLLVAPAAEAARAVAEAFERGIRDGHHWQTSARALATLRQVDPEQLQALAPRVEDPVTDLPAALAGMQPGETLEQALESYSRLQAELRQHDCAGQAARVFPHTGKHRGELLDLARALGGFKRAQETADVFIGLKALGEESLSANLKQFLEALLLTGNPAEAMKHLQATRRGAAVAVEQDFVRLGAVSVRTRQPARGQG